MERLEALVGSTLDGRYALHAVIGSGGSAVVFRGEDLLLERAVAIKMLRSESVSPSLKNETLDEQNERDCEARRINREAFLRESLAAAMLSHPNIVTIHDVCPETDNPYIVMELVEGKPLSERIAALGVLPVHELLYISRCVLEALVEAHAQGIVHRDLKAQNILLTPQGDVKVTDFGIAEISGHRTFQLKGKVLGTVDTMSPEQAAGEEVDARSDLYAVGVLMYLMATGHLPFEDEDPQTVAFLHRTEPPKYPSTLNPGIPRGLEQVILTALEKDPGDRFVSATAMLMAIRRLERNPRHIFHRFPRKRLTLTRRLSEKKALTSCFCGMGIAAILLALSLVFLGLTSTSPVVVVSVPSYVTAQYGESLLIDSYVDLHVRYILRQDLPEGYVIDQYPVAGSYWKLDSEDDREVLWLMVVTHDPSQAAG